jgi:hypothetical protein
MADGIPFNKWRLALVFLLVLLSLPDLLSCQFTAPTILRQAHTAMLTENFVREGFSLNGLYLNIHGNAKPIAALEFPVYNFIVGLAFKVFNFSPFWGKLVSLAASVITLLCLCRLGQKYFGDAIALFSGLFFILSPLSMMMVTAFQPDAMALMFVLIALLFLDSWRESRSPVKLVLSSAALLLGGLAKYPLMVPYVPLMVGAFFFPENRFRAPKLKEIIIISILFAAPCIAWYTYRGTITHPDFGNPAIERSMFLVGDLSRFLSLEFYLIPAYTLAILACSGIGFFFFIMGVRKISPIRITLLMGIPFYFLIIPTTSVQHYYFFSCTPIVALFMADGFFTFINYCNQKRLVIVKLGGCAVFAAAFLAIGIYVTMLRQDTVMWQAAQATKKISAPGDLIFVMNMHNRTTGFGGNNPTLFYLAGRKGWNISSSFTLESSLQQIRTRRSQGAGWAVITWYSPVLEPSVERFIPAFFGTTSDPGINGKDYYHEIKKYFPAAMEAENYAILKL